jgi:hypothetical protein
MFKGRKLLNGTCTDGIDKFWSEREDFVKHHNYFSGENIWIIAALVYTLLHTSGTRGTLVLALRWWVLWLARALPRHWDVGRLKDIGSQ